MICKGDNDTPVAPHIRRGGRALVAMLDLGNAGERLFVSSPPVVFPALGGGRQIERGKINHTVDAKSVRRSVLSALRRISLSSTGKEAKDEPRKRVRAGAQAGGAYFPQPAARPRHGLSLIHI